MEGGISCKFLRHKIESSIKRLKSPELLYSNNNQMNQSNTPWTTSKHKFEVTPSELQNTIVEECENIYQSKPKKLIIQIMGLLAAIAVNVIGGAVIYGTGGLGAGLVAPMLGFGSAGIAGGSLAAAAQSYSGNLVAGSIISKMTAAAMVAPTP